MKNKMEIMKLQEENHKNKFEAIDETMNLEIEQRFTKEVTRNMAREIWIKEYAEEELRSDQIWKEKADWYLKIELESENRT